VNEVRWNQDKRSLRSEVKYELGRRMTTSPTNPVSPRAEVTPDAVVQAKEQSGFVVEVKLGLPKEVCFWDKDIRQVQKYDDDLEGWWTRSEHIPAHDILVLVPLTRAVRFVDRVKDGIQERKWDFRRSLSVTGFIKRSGAKDFITLKQEWGALSDRNLSERLRESVSIHLVILAATYKEKFLDSRPPPPYLLHIIWDGLFTHYAADLPREEEGGFVPLSVTVVRVTKDLQEYYGSPSAGERSPEIPGASLVREALDALVEGKFAERKRDGEYVIRYKRTRSDTLRRFGRLCFVLEQKQRARRESATSFLPGMEPPAS